MHPRQPQSRGAGGDPLGQKHMFQRAAQAARVDVLPPGQPAAGGAQALPIGADLLQKGACLAHCLAFRAGECQVHVASAGSGLRRRG